MLATGHFQSQVISRTDFPMELADENHFLLYDRKLKEQDHVGGLQAFLTAFPHKLGVKSGESLKDIKNFPDNLNRILGEWPSPIRRSQNLVVLGGGSLGDFGGFVASILKRGVGLIHVPSTWLSAMDSAHGGKNALNIKGQKNQVGTFYPAKQVYIVKNLLEAVPREIKEQSYGELIKMALIGQSLSFKEILLENREPEDFLWRFLRYCVEDKYEIVLQDPFETKKVRQVLNFGHTLGHALESHFGWPHGDSVLQGIFFSLEWSRKRGLLSQGGFEEIITGISAKFGRVPAVQLDWYRPPKAKKIGKLIQADKKITDQGEILFVFLKAIGMTSLEPVTLAALLEEAQRQQWVK